MASPHDALVKHTFSDLDNARGELRAALPAEIVALADWSTLALVEGTYVDRSLRSRMTDLLFSVRLSGRDARIYVLFEHQSTPDPFMPLRVLSYQVRIWERWRKANPQAKKIPPIVPLLLAQVPGGWKTSKRLADMIDFASDAEREALLRWMPQLTLIVDDLSLLTAEGLAGREVPETARLAIAALQHARDRSSFDSLMSRLVPWIRHLPTTPAGRHMLLAVLVYLSTVRDDVDAEVIEAAVAKVGAEVEDKVMTTLRQLQQRGREEGREEGIALESVRARAAVLEKLLVLRFSAVPETARTRIASADVATLDRWIERVLTAESVEEVLATR